ncbi:hypothetical protein J5N97_015642 [Dioscorea zingiberensis]|uniref:Uncharacterized protein n=1 Tax=Dioscorea zingiberensis TaxID=325984 RepID=A0A9D5CJJ5_9LILI|nr:hypothetical protein J5N97_015642 [Dioscorea zingiberensis]
MTPVGEPPPLGQVPPQPTCTRTGSPSSDVAPSTRARRPEAFQSPTIHSSPVTCPTAPVFPLLPARNTDKRSSPPLRQKKEERSGNVVWTGANLNLAKDYR